MNEKPKLNKYWKYYKGNQGIMGKVATDVGKPCNRIVSNYCFNIVNTYLGYIAGIDVSYNAPNDFSEIQKVLKYNDVRTEDSEFLRNALIFGKAYEINYIDEDGKQRFKVLDSRECIPVYSNDLNNDLLYVIRYYVADTVNNDQDEYYVEIYGNHFIRKYKSSNAFATLSLLEEKQNYYNQVPITVFNLNADEESIFDKVMTLQDAYNKLLSSEVDDFESFCDAYLVLKGVFAEEDDLAAMKQNRVLMMDTDAEASYLTKSVSDTQIENMLKNINDTIHKIANSPDFNDEKLMAQSGIAMRYKLIGFENVSSAIVASMTKALQRRIELICSILNLTGSEEQWRDVEIVFTRNLPTNIADTAQVVNQLRGIVSDKTLISLLPFIQDVDKELEQIQEEKEANMSLYSFGNPEESENVNE